jgi:hypothetical protein
MEKKKLYSEHACHELNLFLFKKDQAFFRAVVLPGLQTKKDRTFIDRWLLEDDLTIYLEPWAYGQLNTIERVLLADRIAADRPRTERHLADTLALLPPDTERRRSLFEAAVAARALDTADAFGTVAALALQTGAGGIAWGELPLVLLTCLTFSLSDLAILALIKALIVPVEGFPLLSRIHAGGLAMTITYAACGVVALPLVACYRPRHRGDWIAAGQYAAAWLGSMAALYICFGQIGVVFGNILQSTRGIMSVVLGAMLAHLGWHDLEQRVDRATLVKRMTAAALMTAAIALYAIDLR